MDANYQPEGIRDPSPVEGDRLANLGECAQHDRNKS